MVRAAPCKFVVYHYLHVVIPLCPDKAHALDELRHLDVYEVICLHDDTGAAPVVIPYLADHEIYTVCAAGKETCTHGTGASCILENTIAYVPVLKRPAGNKGSESCGKGIFHSHNGVVILVKQGLFFKLAGALPFKNLAIVSKRFLYLAVCRVKVDVSSLFACSRVIAVKYRGGGNKGVVAFRISLLLYDLPF